MRKLPKGFKEDPERGSYYRFPDGFLVIVKDGRMTPVPPHRAKILKGNIYGIYEIQWNKDNENEEWVLVEEIERWPEPQKPVLIPMPANILSIIAPDYRKRR